MGTLVLLDSCDFLVAIGELGLLGKECFPAGGGGETGWTIHAWVSRRHVVDSLVDGVLVVVRTWLEGREGRSSSKGRVLLGGRRVGLVDWGGHGCCCFDFAKFKFL